MLAASILATTLLVQQTPPPRNTYNTDHWTFLAIYKERTVVLNGSGPVQQNAVKGSSVTYDRVGLINWRVLDGGIAGIPCKLYEGDGKWMYKKDVPHTARYEYHVASYTMKYQVTLAGIPLHSETHFKDTTDDGYSAIDIDTRYANDHINVTRKESGSPPETFEMYPKEGMSLFRNMFQPVIHNGLVQNPTVDCEVIHPYTGRPYEFQMRVTNRFKGQYFFLPQEGYCIEVSGPEGTGTIYVTRQGQLLQELMSDRFSASLEEGPVYDESQNWGSFSISDWNKGSDVTNPGRPAYHTYAVPVLFDKPKLLFPVPCIVAD